MTTIDLPDVSALDAARLAEARRQLRSAALWPARVAASYGPASVEPKLTWSAERGAIVTCAFDKDLRLELRPADLRMQFLDHGQPVPHAIELDDRSPAHVEAWLLVEMLHRSIDRSQFSKALPFATGDLLSGDHEKFAGLDFVDELAAMARWLTLAGSVLTRLAPSAPVVVSVPDVTLSVLIGARPEAGGGTAEKRVTFSLADNANPEPYFAVARATTGTVTPLRPDIVLPASQMRRHEMNAESIAERLDGAGARNTAT